jgi:1-acyl-sn-glycerol-3-phosphate acyltransferase
MEALLKVETLGDAANLARELRSSAAPETRPANVTAQTPPREPPAGPPPAPGLVFRALPPVILAVSRLLWGFRVRDAENVPSGGPLIFAANHESFVDGAWLVSALPWRVRRKTFSTGKVELAKSPLARFFLKRSNMIPVEREGDVREALKASTAVLRSGCNLVIFPEGTRTRTGEMGDFKPGVGTLMLETGVQVVPVKITGAYRVWPAGGKPRLLGARKVRPALRFGRPLSVDDLDKGERQARSADVIARALHQVIVEM